MSRVRVTPRRVRPLVASQPRRVSARDALPLPLTFSTDAGTAALSLLFQAVTSTLAIRSYVRRPRGWMDDDMASSLVARTSLVANAGRGIFASCDLPAGTVLGGYPGRLLSTEAYRRKLAQVPRAAEYCWQLQDANKVLDPTDDSGVLFEPSVPCMLFGSVRTTLALINEPAPGADVNVDTVEGSEGVTFVLSRDVTAGEELYLDYGPTYDRSMYG
ncbi:SET domain-containing protein [Pycnococcus provasolii]